MKKFFTELWQGTVFVFAMVAGIAIGVGVGLPIGISLTQKVFDLPPLGRQAPAE